MSTSQQDYKKVFTLSHHARTLAGISSLLDWDHETYMPTGASSIRSEQLKLLAGLIHKEKTDKKYSNSLNKLIDLKSGKIQVTDLSSEQQAALREWRRDYLRDVALPDEFVKEFAQLTSQSQLIWRQAKNENKFFIFAPYLDKIISMCRKKADYLGYSDHPYDALLDLYEPEAKTKEIELEFSRLKNNITSLLQKIISSKHVDDNFIHGKFDTQKQLEFGKKILAAIGYDMTKGRLDISTHPFSSACHPTDSRITTRIHPTSLISNISVLLHEGGHALYEMGLPIDKYGSPLGEAISLGIHESQSRWWETRIGQSKPFWKYYLPLLQKEFKGKLSDIDLETFYKGINKVEPSFIRVEADEVTYPLHVILRFELEKALIEGSLSIRDIPEAWNTKMKDLLGIIPSDNTQGCLQDVHWSMGAFGYFPSYTLGNMYAAHMFPAFEKSHGNWQEQVSQGNFLFIKDWLSENVYKYGRQYTSQELLKKITRKAFTANAYIHYLESKYKEIYAF